MSLVETLTLLNFASDKSIRCVVEIFQSRQTIGIVNEEWMDRDRNSTTRIPFTHESRLAINTQV